MSDDRLLVVMPSIEPGGLATHVRTLCEGAAEHGVAATVVTKAPVDIGWAPGVRMIGVETWGSHKATAVVVELVSEADRVLLLASPETAAHALALGSAQRAAIGVHGTPGSNRPWLGALRFELLRGALAALPGIRLLVPGATYGPGIAKEFGIDPGRVAVMPNATPSPGETTRFRPGAASVLAPMRLALDKRWVLDAAIALANESGRPLTVAGVGVHQEEFRETLTRTATVPVHLVVDQDVVSHIERADVVVAAGLVGLEAMARGRRVVVPSKGGGFAGVVGPETWNDLRSTNFSGWGQDSKRDTAAIWARASSLTDSELDEVQRLVLDHASPQKMFSTFCESVDCPGPGFEWAQLIAHVEAMMEAHDREVSKLHADARSLTEARDWWKGQADEHLARLTGSPSG